MNQRPQSALRAAIDVALAVARDGEAERPPIPSPARLRPYLGFSRLPAAAIDVARRVVEDDDVFRSRVMAATDLQTVGPAGWAWLTRFDGWEDVLAAEESARLAASADHGQAKQTQQLTRRLELAVEALRRAEGRAATATAELESLRVQAAAWRRERRELLERIATLEAEGERAGRDRGQLAQRLADSQRTVATKAAEVRRLREDLAQPETGQPETGQPKPGLVEPRPVAAPEQHLDHDALAVAVAAASNAAAQLGDALAAASRALCAPGAEDVAPSRTPTGALPTRQDDTAVTGPVAHRPTRPTSRLSRRPLPMPSGTFDDSAAAATFLVRVPQVVLLVDGYNVAKQGWPELELAHQRDRLVDALAGLQAITGAAMEVVFDGVDDVAVLCRSALSKVRVCFTPTALEADDLILDMISHVDAPLPVVVVSSDRRVRDGARARGANTLRSEQLLALLR